MTFFQRLTKSFVAAPRAVTMPAPSRDIPPHVRDEYLPDQPAAIAERSNSARARIAALLD